MPFIFLVIYDGGFGQVMFSTSVTDDIPDVISLNDCLYVCHSVFLEESKGESIPWVQSDSNNNWFLSFLSNVR